MSRPPYGLTDGEAWTLPTQPATYHLTPCHDVVDGHTARVLEVTEVAGPETLAGRALCPECCDALGVDAWPPATRNG